MLVNLALREQGLMVARQPKRIKGFALSQAGSACQPAARSGNQILLDYYLTEMEIDPMLINGYQREEFTHLAVAAAVKSNAAMRV